MTGLLAKLLELRGIRGEEEVERFFNPSLADLAKPDELPGVTEAVNAILSAVVCKRHIVVFGDYDCDGVCATAILVRALEALGADVVPFLPKRLTEGYGMSDASVARMKAECPNVDLVVTVDNGINSISQIFSLWKDGVDTVVTDHHLPSVNASGKLVLPNALAIVNPKVAAPAHLRELCGAAVAFLLSNALIARATERGLYDGTRIGGPLLVLAGLATVTDVMPVLGQNRILVAEALKRFRQLAPIGLRELFDRASRSTAVTLSSRDFGFLIGPRINAAGRVANGEEALELITTTDRELARAAAINIETRNTERKQVESKMTDEALEQARRYEGASALVINLPDGHQGVAGIVAARVMERTGVPTGVIAGGHGSARAPQGYNLREALFACEKYLTRFGGHAAAAGFSVKEGMVDEFRGAFAAVCVEQAKAIAADAGAGTTETGLKFDLEADPSELTMTFAEELGKMEPFGEGNSEPVFLFRNAVPEDVRALGADSKHLSCTVGGMKAVWWGRGDLVERLHVAAPRDVAFKIEISTYGSPHVELRIVAMSGVEI